MSSKIPSRQQGIDMESLADSYLQKQGLILHRQNFRCRVGEIDLIYLDQQTLAFAFLRHYAAFRKWPDPPVRSENICARLFYRKLNGSRKITARMINLQERGNYATSHDFNTSLSHSRFL